MTVAVVHVLEAVNIEENHPHASACELAVRQRIAQHQAELRAIGQTGQHITVREKLQLLLTRLLGRDVGEHADVMGDMVIGILDRAQRHALGKDFPALAAIPDLALPVPMGAHSCPHGVVERLVVTAGLEHARGLAQHFLFRKTQQTRERAIDRENAAVRIGHHHALDGVFHHGGCKSAALIGLAAGGLIRQQA